MPAPETLLYFLDLRWQTVTKLSASSPPFALQMQKITDKYLERVLLESYNLDPEYLIPPLCACHHTQGSYTTAEDLQS